MKKRQISHLGKQSIDLLKRELLAIIAVGIVLIWLLGQAMAAALASTGSSVDFINITSPATLSIAQEEATIQTITDVSPPAGGQELFYDQPTIQFGTGIKGYDRTGFEKWKSTTGVKNHGTYLQINTANEVKISGVNNGTYKLWVKGWGQMTINGISFTFKTIRTLTKTVSITNGTMTISFIAGTQIYSISTLPLENESAEEIATAIPNTIAVLPNHSTVILNPSTTTTFRPLAIVVDTNDKQIAITPGLLVWNSSNSEIATVDSSGLVTVHKSGSVTISAQVVGTQLIASTSMVVRPSQEPPVIDITSRVPVTGVPTETVVNNLTPPMSATETPPQPNIIFEFVSNLLNLKPSSATKPTTDILPSEQSSESSINFPATAIQSNSWSQFVLGVQKGFNSLSLWISQAMNYLTSQLNR